MPRPCSAATLAATARASPHTAVHTSTLAIWFRTAWVSTALLSAGVACAQAPTPADATRWLTPALTYDGTAVAALRGGLRRGSTYVGNLHLKLTAKGDLIGWPGASAFADVLTIHGGRPSRLVGDAQGVSNIEGPAGTQVEELWLQQNFNGSVASLLVGIYDLNSEFHRLQAAGLFLNSALGIGPEFAQSGVEGPSIFPRTSAGLRFAVKPTPRMVARLALLDGVPVVRPDGSRAVFQPGDGTLAVAELAWLARAEEAPADRRSARDRIGRFSSLAPYGSKLAFGAWHFSGRFADLSERGPSGEPLSRRGTSGLYLLGEHALSGSDDASAKRWAAFGQVGIADARTNRFGSHFSAGVVGSGWRLIGNADQLGLSITRAVNGSHFMRGQSALNLPTHRAETTVELTYLTLLSDHLTLQPDLQYVRRPNTDPALSDAWVLQLRFELSF